MFVVLPGYRVFCPSFTGGCSEGRDDTQRSAKDRSVSGHSLDLPSPPPAGWCTHNLAVAQSPPDESLTIVFSCQAPPVFVLNLGLKLLLACSGMLGELLSLFANSGHCGVMNLLAL